jgi:hypothetical protein
MYALGVFFSAIIYVCVYELYVVDINAIVAFLVYVATTLITLDTFSIVLGEMCVWHVLVKRHFLSVYFHEYVALIEQYLTHTAIATLGT